MFDLKNKRVFLKRCEYAGIQLKDIYVGAVLNVYSRQLKVTDYADVFTRGKFRNNAERLLLQQNLTLTCKSEKSSTFSKIMDLPLATSEWRNLLNETLRTSQAELRGKQNYQENVEFLSSDLSVGLELIADNCVSKLNSLVSSGEFKNSVYTSESANRAAKDIEFFFSQKSQLSCPAVFNSCSCCVIKPHIITQAYCGQILDVILNAGFQISAMQMFWLDRPSTQEFLEVYKGVVPQYNQLVEQMTIGPCIALEVRQQNAVQSFREVCGPHDPEMAKTVRPRSLRAVYGKDKARNAVHCTDLQQDALLEVEYFFNILQNK